MKYSLRQLAVLMVNLLVVVTLASSAAGFYLLRDHYQTEESRYEAEARNHLAQAANALTNQLQFYQGILDILAKRQSTIDLLSFAEDTDTQSWSQQLRALLPGAFGVGLARLNGEVVGDPLVQRIGDACQADLQHFIHHTSISYPPVHANVPGLEHFDLLANVEGMENDDSGALLISFHLDTLHKLLQQAVRPGDLLLLHTADGQEIARSGEAGGTLPAVFRQTVRGTNWEIALHTNHIKSTNFFQRLILFNLAIMAIVAFAVSAYTRRFANLLSGDMRALHRRIASVLDDNFEDGRHRPRINEIAAILPDIDRLTRTIMEQKQALREQALVDPLTGLHNRRHFDLMMEHVFEHSRRHTPAILLILDVNRFKDINDTLGHKTGDRQLTQVAEHLRSNTRASDEVARIGGDEFAVILQDIDYDRIDQWLDSFIERYDQVADESRHPHLPVGACTLSIGVAVIDARLHKNVSEVINSADLAMYRAKAAGGSGSRYHKAVYHPRALVPDDYSNTASTT